MPSPETHGVRILPDAHPVDLTLLVRMGYDVRDGQGYRWDWRARDWVPITDLATPPV